MVGLVTEVAEGPATRLRSLFLNRLLVELDDREDDEETEDDVEGRER